MQAVYALSVPACCRCGAEHKALAFKPFKRHAGDPSPTHWATCPETGEPLVVCLTGVKLAGDVSVGVEPAGAIAGALALLEGGAVEEAAVFLRKSLGKAV